MMMPRYIMGQRIASTIRRAKRRKKVNGADAGISRRKKKPRSHDPFFADKEVFSDAGPRDVAKNHDKYLAAILARENEQGRRK
jgi:hypothetical protein